MSGMLVPGTWTWSEAIPIAVVALLFVYVPGLIVGLIARARVGLALALAPALTTGIIAAGGMVYGAMRVPWTPFAAILTVAVSWLLAVLGRLAVSAAIKARASHHPERPGELDLQPDDGEMVDPSTSRISGWLRSRSAQTLGTASGTAFAFAFFAWLFVRSSGSPEAFPQHPDTIFHLALPQWMLARGDISYFHSLAFTTGQEGGGYPVGFHDMTATLSLFTGAPVVVVTSALVLVTAGIAWPLGMAELARTVLGPTPQAGAVGAAVSVLFTAYPYMLVTFGVLWPNFYGQALMPGVLVATAAFLKVLQPGRTPDGVWTAGLLGALALPGLALAHFNAFVSFALFAALMTLCAAIARALQRPGGWRRWAPLTATIVLLALAAVASQKVIPAGMLLTGAPGPELLPPAAREDTFQFAPRETETLPVIGILVLIGAIVVLIKYRRRGAWLVPSTIVMMWLFYANVAIDAPWTRQITWPWYNNAVRLAGVGVLPAALLAASAIVGAGALLASWPKRRPVLAAVMSVIILAGVIVGTGGYRDTKYAWMDDLFHPRDSHSWASPQELRSLRALAQKIPQDAVIAADPWRGGTYLYVVSGRQLLWPTEKTNNNADRRLLGLELNDIASDPTVCAAAHRQGVDYVITGGRPFAWARPAQREQFDGINAITAGPGWTLVATEKPYTLYRLTSCAA